jgi:hypothetical protein
MAHVTGGGGSNDGSGLGGDGAFLAGFGAGLRGAGGSTMAGIGVGAQVGVGEG